MSSMTYKYIFGFTATIKHCIYIYIIYLYLLNTIQWILVKVSRTQTHRPAKCFPGVENSCYVFFSLFLLASLQTNLS